MKKNVVFLSSILLIVFVIFGGAISTNNEESSAKTAIDALSQEEQEADSIASDTDNTFENEQEKEVRIEVSDDLKKKIDRIQKGYLKAVLYYENGKKEKAQRYYDSFLAELQELKSETDLNYYLKDDYDNLFKKMNILINKPTSGNEPQKYTVLIDTGNLRVQEYLFIFTKTTAKKRINEALQRSGKYREMILGILRENNMPEELVYLPIVESLYKNNAYSRAQAVGLWQLMSHRARALGLKVNYWVDERRDPEKATRAALKYLRDLYVLFDDWHLALSAYNRGEGGLGRDLKFAQATNIEQMRDRKAVPRETERFVPQFIACTMIGDNYEEYGFTPEFKKPDEYDEVVVDDVIDLKIVANCSNTTLKNIHALNPSIKAWCTPHNTSKFKLRLPKDSKDKFFENIAKVKDLNPCKGFIKYRVARGDCLSTIANKFHTSVNAIQNDNRIKNPRSLKVKQVLVIRPGRKYYKK